jgi:hypothetical protein
MANSFYEDQVRRNRLYAQSLLAQGSDTSPVGHPLAAVARAVQGAMGGYIDYKDEQKDKNDLREMGQFYLNSIQGGQQSQPSAPMPGGNAGVNPMGNLPRMNSRVYDQNEFNPMDAQVATQDELGAGVPAPKQYAALIGKAAVDNDIPPQLLAAQIKQESGFNPNAVSSAGATGISQFMPATAREMGVTNPRDPSQAIPAGAQYLRQNIDKFGGSVPLGLAAYNAGPGRVQRSGGDISRLPAETQGYVKNITGAAPMQMAQAQPQNVQMIAKMLTSENRHIQREGMKLSQALMAQQMAPQKLEKLNDSTLYDPRTGRTMAVPEVEKPIALGKDQRLVKGGKVIVDQQPDKAVKITLGNGQEVTAIQNPDGSFRIPEVQGAGGLAPKLSEGERDQIIKDEDTRAAGDSALSAIREARKLNDQAFSGAGAQTRSWIARNSPVDLGMVNSGLSKEGGKATTQLDNLLTEQALGSMKAIFGGNPTEGERKVLLDLQASSSKSAAERTEILNRAEKLMMARIKMSAGRADAIRGGTYFKPGGGTAPSLSAVDTLKQKYGLD